MKLGSLIFKFICFFGVAAFAVSIAAAAGSPGKISIKLGTKNWINSENYFVCNFNSKPRIGVAILVIKAYKKSGARSSEFTVRGVYGMPEMREHDSEEIKFRQNKAGDYLLPVDIAMRGEWQIAVNFFGKEGILYSGVLKFDVK